MNTLLFIMEYSLLRLKRSILQQLGETFNIEESDSLTDFSETKEKKLLLNNESPLRAVVVDPSFFEYETGSSRRNLLLKYIVTLKTSIPKEMRENIQIVFWTRWTISKEFSDELIATGVTKIINRTENGDEGLLKEFQ